MTYAYYRRKLSLQDQKAYDQLLDGLIRRQSVIDIPFTKQDPSALMQGIIADHPELMDVDFRSFQYVDLYLKKYFRMTYTERDPAAENKLLQMKKKYQSVVTEDMDDWDKAAVIYDTLGSMIRYGFIDGITEHTIKGFLTQETAVCDGIAKMYQYLCDACGLECILIQGTVQKEGHAWNLVRLEGSWYHIDMTADLKICETSGYLSHVMFAGDDASFAKDHTWDHSAYPKCIKKEDYFAHYQKIIRSLLEFTKEVIKARMSGERKINVRFQTEVPLTQKKLQKWMLLAALTGYISVVFAEDRQTALILLQ